MTILRYAPAVRDLHRHQQGIASLQTHALSANFGDELTRHNVDPFILVVVQMEWRATIGVMFSWRKDKYCKASLRVRGTDNLSIEIPDGEGARSLAALGVRVKPERTSTGLRAAR
ncbi:MAG TPA: hypothetical protein VF447_17820 [Terriglobales bacterium]